MATMTSHQQVSESSASPDSNSTRSERYFDASETVPGSTVMAEPSGPASSHIPGSQPRTAADPLHPAQAGSDPSSNPSLCGPTESPAPPSALPTPPALAASAHSTPFGLAHKAERVLGLAPGTLAHAKACLEAARNEMRRLAEADPPGHVFGQSGVVSFEDEGAGTGPAAKGSPLSRAKAALGAMGPSVGLAPGAAIDQSGTAGFKGHSKLPSVVLGTGGKEDESRRERRRKAADGVLFWQKEVGRLEADSTGMGPGKTH